MNQTKKVRSRPESRESSQSQVSQSGADGNYAVMKFTRRVHKHGVVIYRLPMHQRDGEGGRDSGGVHQTFNHVQPMVKHWPCMFFAPLCCTL